MSKVLFRFLGWTIVRHPVLVVVLFAALAGVSAWAAASHLQHRTGQNDLVGDDLEYNRRYLRFEREFGDLEFIYVVLRVDDRPAAAMRAADAIAAELEALGETSRAAGQPLIESVFHRVPPEAMRFGLPFETAASLARLASMVERHADEAAALASVDDLAALFGVFAEGLAPEGLAADGAAPGDGAGSGEDGGAMGALTWGFRVLDSTLRSLDAVLRGERAATLEERLADDLALAPRERGYLATANGAILLVEVAPAKDQSTLEVIREPLNAIRAAIDRVRERFPDVEMGLTGRPVLQADEMQTTQDDIRLATIVALVLVLALFALFFRRLRRPFFSVATLGVSILLTFGVVTATIGYLTLLSIVFAAMLVGLGIDFGIHFVARYQDELLVDGDVARAIRATLETTGRSIGTGAVTTAAAFFTILLVDFQGLRELGFIAGVGVLICFVAMTTLLPAVIYLADRWSASRRKLHPPRPVRIPLIGGVARHPRAVLAIAALVTAAGLFEFGGIPYDSNIIELQAQELESVRYERYIIENSDVSTWYCAFVVEDIAGVRRVVEDLRFARDTGIVGGVESVLDYIPANQQEKIPYFETMTAALGGVSLPEPASEVQREELIGSLDHLLDRVDELSSLAIRREEVEAARTLASLAARTEDITESLAGADDATLARVASFQVSWLGEIGAAFGDLVHAVRPEPLVIEDLPHFLQRRLVSRDGERYLVKAYPNRDIWQEEHMEDFVRAVRRVDPLVTGTPIQVWESSRRMRDGFLRATWYSLGVTLLLLLLDLRSLRWAVLAMVPLVFGLLWLLESLPLTGLEFNLANFFALPILIGCGIDGGVHIVHRFRTSRSARDVLETTCSAVTLSFVTTMAGFGAMAFASHRGIRSLGLMMFAGLVALLIASVVVLPSVLAWVERRERTRGRAAS